MDREAFEFYLDLDRYEGIEGCSAVGTAGSAECGDVVTVGLEFDGKVVTKARFKAEGCGACAAAASAALEMVDGEPIEVAARLSHGGINDRLGGLTPSKYHAATLVSDALHRSISQVWALSGANDRPTIQDRVVVAFSGGVDSAVAAHLAMKEGKEVIAVTVKLWADPEVDGTKACCSPEAVMAARELAHSIGIPHFTLDLQSAFSAEVVGNFVDEYSAGRTPNPCVLCNGYVRIERMIDLARRLGASKLTTGHYARIAEEDYGPLLQAGNDPVKDQSYMLSALAPELLAMLDFPLGGYSKSEIREIARAAQLPVAEKAESQDLCFLAGTDKATFLRRHGSVGKRPGRIVGTDNTVLGTHEGVFNYTVGQRKGLGLSSSEPLYVLSTEGDSDTVKVGSREELRADAVSISGVRLYRDSGRVNRVKLRYRQSPTKCRIGTVAEAGDHGSLQIDLPEPVFGVAPGQTACLMDGDLVVGWGVIESSTPIRK